MFESGIDNLEAIMRAREYQARRGLLPLSEAFRLGFIINHAELVMLKGGLEQVWEADRIEFRYPNNGGQVLEP